MRAVRADLNDIIPRRHLLENTLITGDQNHILDPEGLVFRIPGFKYLDDLSLCFSCRPGQRFKYVLSLFRF